MTEVDSKQSSGEEQAVAVIDKEEKTEEVEVKQEEKTEVVEVKQENKENLGDTMNKTFLDDITVEAEGNTGGESSKKDDVIDRKVVILNIDKTKTNDDIEDYLYDNYPDYQIDNFKVIRFVPHRVVVTFESKEKADAFVSAPFVKGELIGFQNKIKKLSLEEFRTQSADRKKMKVNTENGLVVSCSGFQQDKTKEAILDYMKNNHEEATDVERREDNIFVTFGTKTAADRFVGLAYVKHQGQYITRQKPTVPAKKSPAKKTDRKRKLNDSKESSSSTGSACLKLKGFKNPQTTFKSIQEALDRVGVKKFDIQFIQYNSEVKEAVVTLRNATVATMALQLLKEKQLKINNDRIVPEDGTSSSTSSNKSSNSNPNKLRKLKSSENLQKAKKIRGWTHY